MSLKTRQMLQNVLIICTFVWNLMRMVDYTRLYDKRDDFDVPTFNFRYISSHIPESYAYDVSFTVDNCARVYSKNDFLFRGSILKLLSQGYSEQKLQTTGFSYRPCVQIWHLCVTYIEVVVYRLWHATYFQLIVTGATCGQGEIMNSPKGKNQVFPHKVSISCHPLYIYTLHNLSVLGLCLRNNDWFVCLD